MKANTRKLTAADEILGQLLRRHSTATVLFHQAVAEHIGLGPTDHKCLDVLRERGPMIGQELAAVTGLTSGAVTGIVARLEQAGFISRIPDPKDQRKLVIKVRARRVNELESIFGPIRQDANVLLDGFDARQLTVIAKFLNRSIDFMYSRAALLRAHDALNLQSQTITARGENTDE